ncbi:hypothetical protein Ancab_012915 [Ancistrocladus abbreviatus]
MAVGSLESNTVNKTDAAMEDIGHWKTEKMRNWVQPAIAEEAGMVQFMGISSVHEHHSSLKICHVFFPW